VNGVPKVKVIVWKSITIRDKISFQSRHHKYGRAQFLFCPMFKNGKMKSLFIQALQQERPDMWWKLDCEIPVSNFQIESWTHKTEHPNIWRESWCLDHKCVSHEVSVPKDTDEIVFSYFFGNSLSIRFQKQGDT
jgi:hypothetical protein